MDADPDITTRNRRKVFKHAKYSHDGAGMQVTFTWTLWFLFHTSPASSSVWLPPPASSRSLAAMAARTYLVLFSDMVLFKQRGFGFSRRNSFTGIVESISRRI